MLCVKKIKNVDNKKEICTDQVPFTSQNSPKLLYFDVRGQQDYYGLWTYLR